MPEPGKRGNMSFIPSKATESDVTVYMEGSCHDFACALHRYTGWPFIIVYDKSEPSIHNEDGEILHSLMHVACLDPNGNVWDVTGRITRVKAANHFRKYMDFGKVGFDVLASPAELERYIGFGPYQVLAHQYDSTHAWADRDARRILRDFGILPPPDEFTDQSAHGSLDGYSSGIASLNLAIGISTHFTYPIALAFGQDDQLIRAWAEDLRGRPIAASGLLQDHSELNLPEEASVKIWEIPHHALGDERISHLLGTENLNAASITDAFQDAQRGFHSIKDTKLNGERGLSLDMIKGNINSLLEEVEYDIEYGGTTLQDMAARGKHHVIPSSSQPVPIG
jgi:hypothetical protein